MNRSLKTICIKVLLALSLHTPAKAQQGFIDSIRNMLIDLNEQVQFAPVNQLLQQNISFCTADTINDSLAASLKKLISPEYILQEGILQPVSPHLLRKYDLFILRIAGYFLEKATAESYNRDMMRVAIARIYLSSYSGERALYFKQAKELMVQIQFTEPCFLAEWLWYFGRIYESIPMQDSCCFMYKQSLLLNPDKTFEEHKLYTKTLFWLANFYRMQDKPDSSLLFFQQLLHAQERIQAVNSDEYVFWLLTVADAYTYMARYKAALELNFRSLEVMQNTSGNETGLYALCLNNIGEVYYRTGEYDKSLIYAQQALALKQKIFGNDYFDNVVNLHNLATLYTRMGLYNEAVPLLQESLAISKKYFGEEVVYAANLHPLAEAYENLGEYDKALPLYQKALPILSKSGVSNFYYPRTLQSMASLFIKLGQYDKAIDYFIQALKIKKDVFGEFNPEYVNTLNSYAEACLLKEDYKRALSLQLQSLAINKKLFGNIHPSTATGYYNLSALYYRQHKLQKAGEACELSLQMRKKILGSKHPDVAACYDMLGNINNQMHNYNAALNYYNQAFEIRKSNMTATHPGYINSLYNLGMIYIKKGRAAEAAQLFTKADSAALLHIEQSYTSLSEEGKLTYLHTRENQFQYLPSLLYLQKINRPEIVNRIYSNAIVLKSMVLFHQQQVYNSIRKSGDSSALNLYNLWRFNKGITGQQILLPVEKRLPGFDSLQNVTAHMEEQLSRISVSFRNNMLHHKEDAGEILMHLSKDEAAIEFIRFRLFNNHWTDSIIYAALVLLPGEDNVIFIPLCEEKQLKKILRFSNNTGKAAINYLYPAAGKETIVSNELYRLVWQPLQPFLTSVHTVYYSPCGLLCKLSFAALHAGMGKMPADKFTLKQLLCTRSLAWPEEDKNYFTNAGLWGNIDYNHAVAVNKNSLPVYDSAGTVLFTPVYDINKTDKSFYTGLWPSLPGTKTETETIYSLLKEKNITCKQETESNAGEEKFKRMDGNSPGLLHIATHGFFLSSAAQTNNYYSYEHNSFSLQQNPMFRSGLLLAGANTAWSGNTSYAAEDGVLTAYEIAQLDLSNTKLVTLSACETALGDIQDNEGVYGLQRAFKMAGVKHVLMSLWKIPDEETSAFMLLFYSSLLKSNDPNTALHNARLAMKEKYPPYYWAGFVVTE